MAYIRNSEIESERFGMRIGRADCSAGVDVDVLLQEVRSESFDVVIVRTLSIDRDLPRELIDRGLRVIPADTLVYYGSSLIDWNYPSSRPSMGFRVSRPDDIDQIFQLARRAFDGYTGHYGASPQLDAFKVRDGYADWAGRLARGDIADSRMFIMEVDGQVAAFIGGHTVLSESANCFEISLNAVCPDFQRNGIYSGGMALVMQELKKSGFHRVIISTQVWNSAVQSAWHKLGFLPYKSLNTYHVSQF